MLMGNGQTRRQLEKALRRAKCTEVSNSGRGSHTKWQCPCGQHTANVPRHTDISPGVVRDIQGRLSCLPEGWIS